MKILDIAFKDISRSFRSAFALVFMFGVPILMTLMFSLIFGGIGGETDDPQMLVAVRMVNLDQGDAALANGIETDYGKAGSMGESLLQIMAGIGFDQIMTIEVTDETSARQAVDAQKAGVAVIIPKNFTTALIQTDESAVIEFYQDPALTIGPEIVKTIVMGMVNQFAGANITLEVVETQLADKGITMTQAQWQQVLQALTSSSQENNSQAVNIIPAVTVEAEAQSESLLQHVMTQIMGGMMIMYAFFTGVNQAQTILAEQEKGTLPRLFTTPTPISAILNGKMLAAFLIVLVQIVVLIIFARFVFNIYWGTVFTLMLFTLSTVLAAGATGIFAMSLIKSSRQAGLVIGGGMTLTGMIGIMSVFTAGTPASGGIFNYLSLVVPQGWSMAALQASWEGEFNRVLLYAGGLVVWAFVLFLIGNARFKKRFA